MDDHQSFLDEIIASPDDDAPRLIYADWLEEQGNPRGEFIRVQCEMHGLKNTQKRFRELRLREQQLLKTHSHEWALPYAFRRCVYRRGFVEECAMALSYFIKSSQKYMRMTPLRDIVFTRMKDQLEKLAEVPEIGRLNSIHFKTREPRVGELAFVESPHLAGLKRIRAAYLTNDALIKLAESPHASSLTSLELPYANFQDDTVAELARSPHLANLQQLILTNSVQRGGVQKLCGATFASNLQELDISQSDIDDIEFGMIVASSKFSNLEVLRAGQLEAGIFQEHGGVKGIALQTLAASPRLSKIRMLNLGNHPLSFESIEALGESEYRVKGAQFRLGGGRLSQSQIRQLQQRFGKTFGHLAR